jgi:hypothetical protein
MRRVDIDWRLRVALYPSTQDAAARENERVRTFAIDDGYFQVAVKRRAADFLPHRHSLPDVAAVLH